MNMKKIGIFSLIICIMSICIFNCGFMFFKKQKDKAPEINNIAMVNDYKPNNNVWCVTFQLVWNDFMDKLNNSKPVEFVEGNPPLADELNKRLYTSDILSPDSYYKTYGKISKKLKKQIESDIYKKFKEKSDILDKIDWNAKDSILFYAMLKKDFNFLTAFDEFNSASFNNSKENVKYFGVDEKSKKKLRENIDVLFYNSADEYAVKLLTKEKEEVILYRTDKKDNFENLYAYVMNNTKFDEFTKLDILKVPQLNVDKTISYDELCGKKIVNSDYIITQALQTIKFKMDKKGGTLKSEAAMSVMKMALMPEVEKQRFFLFDKPFVLFLKEENKDKPYFAMFVEDTSFLVKE